jgi:hypothetical protein
LVHRYYGAVRLLRSVHAFLKALALTSRTAPLPRADSSEVSRSSCMKVPGVPGVYDYAGFPASSRLCMPGFCLPRTSSGSAPRIWVFEAQYPARQCLCLRFACCLTTKHAKFEVRTVRYSFPARLFHSRLHAGLSRRTDVFGFQEKFYPSLTWCFKYTIVCVVITLIGAMWQ